jgi:hypothetical protein
MDRPAAERKSQLRNAAIARERDELHAAVPRAIPFDFAKADHQPAAWDSIAMAGNVLMKCRHPGSAGPGRRPAERETQDAAGLNGLPKFWALR